jgi:uncharacterized protein (DUF302 family)
MWREVAMGNTDVSAIKAPIEHVTVVMGVPYDKLVSAFEAELGRLDSAAVQALVTRRAPWNEVESEIERIGGAHGLMIVASANQGAITSLSGNAKRCILYIVGNPVIADKIIAIDIRASFYVPFRVALFDLGKEGGAIAYDRPSSFLATLGRPELKHFGALLDGKIDGVINAVRSKA